MRSLSEIAEAIVDCEHKTAPEGDGYAFSVGTRAMKAGRLVLSACKPVSEATYKMWTRRMQPRPADLVLAREAPVGDVVRVPDEPRLCLGQRTVLIRPDASQVHPRFLHYWLLGPIAQDLMTSRAAGATVPHLNVEDIRDLDVSAMPTDPRVQRFAADLLGAIDDLIENNGRRIELLEQMAQVIYREWFVRFRYPGHENVPLVDSPLGSIPLGWEARDLFDVAAVGFGYSFKSNRFADAGPFPVVRIRDVPAGATKTFTDEEPPVRYKVRDGDVLIGMDGDFHLRQWTGGEAWLNQRVARVRPVRGLTGKHLMLAVAEPIKAWNTAITGTTVAHLGKRHLEQIQIVVPSADILGIVADLFNTIERQECALTQGCRDLAMIRDLLLPKLVTGQIDVSDLDLDDVVGSVA